MSYNTNLDKIVSELETINKKMEILDKILETINSLNELQVMLYEEKYGHKPANLGLFDIEESGKIPDSLINHKGWKRKKIDAHNYTEGNLNFGWDFGNNFPSETIAFLASGEKTIDKYVFTYDQVYNTVKVQKVKQK